MIKSFSVIIFFVLYSTWTSYAQSLDIPEEKVIKNSSGVWLGLYTKYRISERSFYYGEYHARTRSGVQDMAQVYLRFGISHLVSKYFEVTAGFVNPWYWAPNLEAPNIDKIVPQLRGWQQLLFVSPFDRLKIYHQLRFEQRFRRDFREGSPFELTHRFRYKLMAYYPLNKEHLENKAIYLSTYNEIFIQAGKSIVYDHFEDNRLFIGLGYIINDEMQIQSGYMWTFRHKDSPFIYENRHIFRFSVYHNLDLYKKKKTVITSPFINDF